MGIREDKAPVPVLGAGGPMQGLDKVVAWPYGSLLYQLGRFLV